MITTAAGLSIGIPSLMFHRYFRGRINELTVEIEQQALSTSGSFTSEKPSMKFATPVTEEVSINLTPLIDIVFLSSDFFMVSTTFQRETELEIALPEASAQSQSRESVSAVVLEINSQGLYRLGTQSADGISEFISVEFENLGEILEGISGKYATTTLVIKADAKNQPPGQLYAHLTLRNGRVLRKSSLQQR